MSDRVEKVLAELLNDLYDVTEPVIDHMLKRSFNINISVFFKGEKKELFEDTKRAINAAIMEALLYDHLIMRRESFTLSPVDSVNSFEEVARFYDLIAESFPLVDGMHTLMENRLENLLEDDVIEGTVYECMSEAIELLISRLTVLEPEKVDEDTLKDYLKYLEVCKPAISYKVKELNW